MCIRDSGWVQLFFAKDAVDRPELRQYLVNHSKARGSHSICLLYTSDAADERSSVDLGGRRIIKKKNQITLGYTTHTKKQETAKRLRRDTTDREHRNKTETEE